MHTESIAKHLDALDERAVTEFITALHPSASIGRVATRRASKGMTLIEIMIVIAIIGLIMGVLAFALMGRLDTAKDKTAVNEVTRLSTTAEMFEVEKGKCPKDMAALKAGGYIKKIMKDPWGTPYELKCPGEHGRIDVSSAGPDQELGNEDDINSWQSESDEKQEDEES